MNLHQLFLTENNCYKAGTRIKPTGIMVHSTGADNPNLRRYIGPDDGRLGVNPYGNHWNTSKPDGKSVCVHAFIGKLWDGAIATYQTLPWDMRGWHCGGKANDTHISFEICEDGMENADYLNAVYKEAVELCAMLCRQYGIAPAQIICHAEGYKLGLASNHGDVIYWWSRHGLTMDDFRAAVAAEMEDEMTKDQVLEIIKEYESEKAKEAPAAWSQEARSWAEGSGIIAGDGEGNMQYKSSCTREQMVIFLHRLWKLTAGKNK